MSMELRERSQAALEELESCIVSLLEQYPAGLRNVDIADQLGLHSDMNGGQKDYLTWSVLGLLMQQRRVIRTTASHGKTTHSVYKVR